MQNAVKSSVTFLDSYVKDKSKIATAEQLSISNNLEKVNNN